MFIKKILTFSVSSLALAAISSLSLIAVMSQQAVAADLTVNISEVNQGKGHVMVGLYSGSKAFNQGKAMLGSSVKATNEQEEVVFKDLPAGEYAIKIYQDENSNDKLDFNFIGIPKEGYGFSNNVGRFSRPEYQEAKFTIEEKIEKAEINIELF
ncbi:MAG TPA: hypothetical protein DIS98_14705 [Colwellia sp.]|nr:hypothetical protein [Colwellia sp.]|tara:strand:- start:9 stop:470 length:462 start_codon:yes stop_codon:yes gene_type:complete